MKVLIQEVEEVSGSAYQLYAELKDCPSPEGFKQLTFSSVWTGAKHPKEHQIKESFILSPFAVQQLKDMLGE